MNLNEVKQLLSLYGIYLTKKRGQNFLIDDNVTESLLRKALISPNDHILEIGTGFGALTKKLCQTNAQIVSYEIDKKVHQAAKEYLKDHGNLKLIHENFLESDYLKHFKAPFRVIANIPYNIASQILISLWLQKDRLKDIFILVQKEFGERFINTVQSHQSGFFSVLLQLDYNIKVIHKVSRHVFFPEPKVDSVYLHFSPIKNNLKNSHRKSFFEFVKTGFSQKRKKVINNLKTIDLNIEDSLKKLNLQPEIRPHEITPPNWLQLYYQSNQDT